jgi:hypothetical protein
VFVVGLAGLQAVMQLAEEFVEQVSLGVVVTVSGGAAGIEVAATAGGGAQRSQRPDRADGGQAPVFDMAVQHNGFLAASAGDGGRAGEGLEPAGVGQAGAVITDPGQHPGTGQHPQPGEAGDDLGVRVLLNNVVECYGDLAELEWKFPVGSLIDDDASHLPEGVLISSLIDEADHLPEEVIDGLESLAQAARIVVNNGPDILWAFAKAAGISDEVRAILDEQDARRKAIDEDTPTA